MADITSTLVLGMHRYCVNVWWGGGLPSCALMLFIFIYLFMFVFIFLSIEPFIFKTVPEKYSKDYF